MHRGLLAAGLLCLAAFSVVALLVYPDARSNCATDVFTGNATNPGACSQDENLLGGSVLAIAVAIVVAVVALFLGRGAKVLRERSTPGHPEGAAGAKAPKADGRGGPTSGTGPRPSADDEDPSR